MLKEERGVCYNEDSIKESNVRLFSYMNAHIIILEDNNMSKKTIIKKEIHPTDAKKTKEESENMMKVDEQKKLTTEKEKKRITASPEAKKIAAKKEPKKIAAKPEPPKITAKPELKKLTEKKKAVKTDAAAKITEKTAVKVKKDMKSKTVKTVKGSKDVKKTTDVSAKIKPKASIKASAAKKIIAKKDLLRKENNPYNDYSVERCISSMQAMGVGYEYKDYTCLLLDEKDINQIEKNIIDGNQLKAKAFTFEKDGYDSSLVKITLQKIADTMDIKASDFETIKKDIKVCLKTQFTDDVETNATEYLHEFRLCEKLLMIGQRKNITEANVLKQLYGIDADEFVNHFFKYAYGILPTWQYSDVKFYEDFAYALLSQFTDLYEKYELNLLIDCADLYIKHGDFQHGDENYGYILRDNQIKDYIYYRFASIYEDIDYNKAKALAYEALGFVDERFIYYKDIMNIINQ